MLLLIVYVQITSIINTNPDWSFDLLALSLVAELFMIINKSLLTRWLILLLLLDCELLVVGNMAGLCTYLDLFLKLRSLGDLKDYNKLY